MLLLNQHDFCYRTEKSINILRTYFVLTAHVNLTSSTETVPVKLARSFSSPATHEQNSPELFSSKLHREQRLERGTFSLRPARLMTLSCGKMRVQRRNNYVYET